MVAAEKRTSERLPGPDGPVSTMPRAGREFAKEA